MKDFLIDLTRFAGLLIFLSAVVGICIMIK